MENAKNLFEEVKNEFKKMEPEQLEKLQTISHEVDHILAKYEHIENAHLAILLSVLHRVS